MEMHERFTLRGGFNLIRLDSNGSAVFNNNFFHMTPKRNPSTKFLESSYKSINNSSTSMIGEF
ncbi:hypothetical protein Ahy_A01g000594 isoform D [Arachis hypogaea]|uniref:Uncharacterized protein n=1 Tax=Arachis hypogaea TaxID=3818 RepID=A0A445EKW5_ARAHY|nr:hypothetical protein Ahy_A01g000594 isoform D [Arachis hypogaea]